MEFLKQNSFNLTIKVLPSFRLESLACNRFFFKCSNDPHLGFVQYKNSLLLLLKQIQVKVRVKKSIQIKYKNRRYISDKVVKHI